MTDCIFCKIGKGEIPSKKVYEDDKVLVFHDIEPTAPVHVLVIPKSHIGSINEINNDNSNIIAHIFTVINKIVLDLGIAGTGYRIVSNCGKQGGQTVEHLHFHVLGGRNLEWPPG